MSVVDISSGWVPVVLTNGNAGRKIYERAVRAMFGQEVDTLTWRRLLRNDITWRCSAIPTMNACTAVPRLNLRRAYGIEILLSNAAPCHSITG